MGLLDSILGAVTGARAAAGAPAGSQGALLDVVLGMLAQRGQPAGAAAGGSLGSMAAVLAGLGGISGLIAKFQQAGLGDVIGSWIGRGHNLPVSADQLQNVLGPDVLAQIAQHLGVSHGEAAGQLSQLLPEVVDRLTPQGELPADGVGDIGDILDRFKPR